MILLKLLLVLLNFYSYLFSDVCQLLSESGDCLLCSSSTYKSGFYFQERSLTETGSKICYQKITPTNVNQTVIVISKSKDQCSECKYLTNLGTLYYDLFTAIYNESLFASKNLLNSTNFYLYGEDPHFFIMNPDVTGIQFFRSSSLSISIQPFDCSMIANVPCDIFGLGRRARIVLKSPGFEIFIEGNMTITNIDVISSDLNLHFLSPQPDCLAQRKICCEADGLLIKECKISVEQKVNKKSSGFLDPALFVLESLYQYNYTGSSIPTLNIYNSSFKDMIIPSSINEGFKSFIKIRTLAGANVILKSIVFVNFGLFSGLILLDEENMEDFFIKKKLIQNVVPTPESSTPYLIFINNLTLSKSGGLYVLRESNTETLILFSIIKAKLSFIINNFHAEGSVFENSGTGGVCIFYFSKSKAVIDGANIFLTDLEESAFLNVDGPNYVTFKHVWVSKISLTDMNFFDVRGGTTLFVQKFSIIELVTNNTNIFNMLSGEFSLSQLILLNVLSFKVLQVKDCKHFQMSDSIFENIISNAYFFYGDDSMIYIRNSSMTTILAEFNIFCFLNTNYNFTQIKAMNFISDSIINAQVLKFHAIHECLFTDMNRLRYFLSPGGIFFLFFLKDSTILNSKFTIFISNYVPSDFDKCIFIKNITIKNVYLKEYLFEICCLSLILTEANFENIILDTNTGRSPAALEVGPFYMFSNIKIVNIGVDSSKNFAYARFLYQGFFYMYYSPIFLLNFTIIINTPGIFLPTGLVASGNPVSFILLKNVRITIAHSDQERNFKVLTVSYPKLVLIVDSIFEKLQCSNKNLGLLHESGTFSIFNYPHFGGERKNENQVTVLNTKFQDCECRTASVLLIVNYNRVIIRDCLFSGGTAYQSGFIFIMATYEIIFFRNEFITAKVETTASFLTLSQISNIHMMDNIFNDGFAKGSGAIYMLRVDNCVIINMVAFNVFSEGDGGFFYLDESKLNVMNSRFANIASDLSGGFVYSQTLCEVHFKNVNIFNSSANSRGTGYFEESNVVTFENTSIRLSFSNFESSVLEASSFAIFTMVRVNISHAYTESRKTIYLHSASSNQYLYFENVVLDSNHAEDFAALFFNTFGNIIIRNLDIRSCSGQGLIMVLAKTEISMLIEGLNLFSNSVGCFIRSGAYELILGNFNISGNWISSDFAFELLTYKVYVYNILFLNNKLLEKTAFVFNFKEGVGELLLEDHVFSSEKYKTNKFGLIQCVIQCGKLRITNITAAFENNEDFPFLKIRSGNLSIYKGSIFCVDSYFLQASSINNISLSDLYFYDNSIIGRKGAIISIAECSFVSLTRLTLLLTPSSTFFLEDIKKLFLLKTSFYRQSSQSNNTISYLTLNNVAAVSIDAAIFFRGKAEKGAALYLACSTVLVSVLIKNSLFIQNRAISGGAIYLNGVTIYLEIASLIFFENKAMKEFATYFNFSNDGVGGALYAYTSSDQNYLKSFSEKIIFFQNFAENYGPNIFMRDELVERDYSIYLNNTDGLNFTNESSSGPVCIQLIPRGVNNDTSTQRSCGEYKLSENISSGVPTNLSFYISNKQGNIPIYENSVRAYLKTRERAVVLSQKEVISVKGKINFFDVILKQKPNSTSQISLFLEFGEKNLFITKKEFIIVIYTPPCSDGEIQQVDFTCKRCSSGTFSSSVLAAFEIDRSVCSKCFIDFVCFGGNILFPRSGYWRFSNRSNLALKCIISSACISYSFIEGNIVETPCAPGHQGVLCNECELGYGKFQKNRLCISCEENRELYILRVVLFSVGLCLYVFLNVYFFTESIKSKTTNKSPFIVFKIMVNHMQLISIISTMEDISNIPYLDDLNYFQYYISFVSEDIISIDCLIQKYIDDKGPFLIKVLITLVFPIVFGIASIFFWIFLLFLFYVFRFKQGKRAATLQKILVGITICTYILYPLMIQKIFSLTNCTLLLEDTNDLSNSSYLYENPSVKCWEDKHLLYFYGLFLPSLLIWGIFFPFLLYRILKKNYNIVTTLETLVSKSSKGDGNEDVSMIVKQPVALKSKGSINSKNKKRSVFQALTDASTIEKKLKESRVFRFFYEDYKPDSYYWEIVIFIKKFFLTMCVSSTQLIGFETNSFLQTLIIIIYCTYLMRKPPFFVKVFNFFDLTSNLIAILTKLLITISNSKKITNEIRVLLFIIILFVNAIWMTSLFYYFLTLLKQRRNKVRIATLIGKTTADTKSTPFNQLKNFFKNKSKKK